MALTMLPEHPTPFELRQAQLRAFATTSPLPAATAAACVRALHHRRGWDDLGAEDIRSLVSVGCGSTLARWLQDRGHDAREGVVEDYKMDDLLWWQHPDQGQARFVICRGEQPGVRVAYWDPMTGAARWHRLDEGAPGTGVGDRRVRIHLAVAAQPPVRLRRGWRAWILGV